MEIFALQIKTGDEEHFIRLVSKIAPELEGSLNFIKKEETRKKNGKKIQVLAPVFPGYVFFTTDSQEIAPEIRLLVKKTRGFFRFLPDNESMRPLVGKDLLVVRKLSSIGPVAKKSLACFDENDHIVILEGPLKGLEGCISRVDKRKGRVTIVLDMYRNSFPITLGVEFIVRS